MLPLAKQAYDEAKNAYNQALTIKPNEAYPKQKIAEIDKILADKAAKENSTTIVEGQPLLEADVAFAKQAHLRLKRKTSTIQALTIKTQ